MFDWEDFLVLARELSISSLSEESKLRTSISRTYYSMFHRAQDFCKMKGVPTPPIPSPSGIGNDNSPHMRIISGMRKYNDSTKNYKEVIFAGRLLDTLRIKRVHADYTDAPFGDAKTDATNAISTAEQIIKTLDNF